MPEVNDTLDILRSWTQSAVKKTPRRANETFREFVDWIHFHGLEMPVDGEDVGYYLLGLLGNGESLATLRKTAAAIQAAYVEQRTYLDPRPIEAALSIAETQLSINRTLN